MMSRRPSTLIALKYWHRLVSLASRAYIYIILAQSLVIESKMFYSSASDAARFSTTGVMGLHRRTIASRISKSAPSLIAIENAPAMSMIMREH